MKWRGRKPDFLVICCIWLAVSGLCSALWVHRAIQARQVLLESENLQEANHLASRLRYARQEAQGFLWALSRSRDLENVFQEPGIARLLPLDRPIPREVMLGLPAVTDLSRRLERMAKDLDSRLVFVLDARGHCVASSDWRAADPALGQSMADRAYFQEALRGGVGQDYLVGRHSGVLGSYFAVPIHSGARILGCLVLQQTAEDWAARIGLGHSPALVANEEGVILFSNRKAWSLSTLPGRSAPTPERCQSLYLRPSLPPAPLTVPAKGFLRDPEGRLWMHVDVPVFYSPLRVHLLSSTEPLGHHARGLWMKATLVILLGWVALWITERMVLRVSALKRLSWVDPLTQVLNRRGFDIQALQEWTRSRRFGRPLSMLTIDLDHFKAVNDRFGHPAGDQVLRTTASLCKVQLRDMDVVGRMGGEEFMVLLPETDLKQARQVAERIRIAVQNLTTTWNEESIPTTVSIGVAMLQPADNTLMDLAHRADQALYRAKQKGRNRVEE